MSGRPSWTEGQVTSLLRQIGDLQAKCRRLEEENMPLRSVSKSSPVGLLGTLIERLRLVAQRLRALDDHRAELDGAYGDDRGAHYGGYEGYRQNASMEQDLRDIAKLAAALPPAPPQEQEPDDRLETIELVANSLHDVAMVGWSPAVDAQRWAHDLETHLRGALERLAASPPAQEPRPYIFRGGIPSQCGEVHPEPPHHRCHCDNGHDGPHETGHGRWEGEYPNAKPVAAPAQEQEP